MCRLLSGYVAMIDGSPRVWVSETTDSHSVIAAEFGLRDNGMHQLYAWELYPNHPNPDVTTWVLKWDSGATFGCREKPNRDDAIAFRAAIERTAKRFVFTGQQVSSSRGWYFDQSQCHQPSGGEQWLYGQSQCHQPSGGKQVLCGQSQCHQPSGGEQWLYGQSQCHQPSGGKQVLYGQSQCHQPSGGEQVLCGGVVN